MLAVADVLDILDHVRGQPVFPHDRQHLPVHQVVRPEAVGITAVPSGEVFTNVESFTWWLLATDLLSTFPLVTFADLRHKERVALYKKHC